jgi:hypothetical protein
VCGLELLEAEATETAMATPDVVEEFDVAGDIRKGELSTPIDVLVDPLLLRDAVE